MSIFRDLPQPRWDTSQQHAFSQAQHGQRLVLARAMLGTRASIAAHCQVVFSQNRRLVEFQLKFAMERGILRAGV